MRNESRDRKEAEKRTRPLVRPAIKTYEPEELKSTIAFTGGVS